jgi:hypothetical protein
MKISMNPQAAASSLRPRAIKATRKVPMLTSVMRAATMKMNCRAKDMGGMCSTSLQEWQAIGPGNTTTPALYSGQHPFDQE